MKKIISLLLVFSLIITSFTLGDISQVSAATGSTEVKNTGIAMGDDFTLLLRSDGKVLTWGGNSTGQLGINNADGNQTSVNGYIPKTFVAGGDMGTRYLEGITDVEAGANFSVALTLDGYVYTWGGNTNGQLGNNTTAASSSPAKVKDTSGTGYLSGITQISAGTNYVVAVRGDGAVFSWGGNTSGQLGDGTTTQRLLPVQVLSGAQGGGTNLTAIKRVSAGYNHVLAVTTTGDVYAWGSNEYGKLGIAVTTTSSSIPVKVDAGDAGSAGTKLTAATLVGAGYSHSIVIANSGKAYSWGRNNYGQLGLGFNSNLESLNSAVPKAVPIGAGQLGGIVDLSVANYYTLLLSDAGEIAALGRNEYNQIADGDSQVTNRLNVTYIASPLGGRINNIIKIYAGNYHAGCIMNDGQPYLWGLNTSGQLADGTVTNKTLATKPIQAVRELNDVVQIATGTAHSIALKSDGTVYAWGSNGYYQLGDGTNANRSTPVQVVAGEQGGGTYLHDIVSVWAGFNRSYAIDKNGQAYVWGYDNYSGGYALGNGTTGYATTPQIVHNTSNTHGFTGVKKIAVGYMHTVALKNDGTVYAWGDPYTGTYYYLLGNSSYTTAYTYPVAVSGVSGSGSMTGIVDIAAGYYNSAAVSNTGAVYCWGYGGNGVYGNGNASTSQYWYPVQVSYITNAVKVAYQGGTSNDTCYALQSDGRIRSWGYGTQGELGDGTYDASRATPVYISDTSMYTDFASGTSTYFMAAIKQDKTGVSWGYNTANGQLCIGNVTAGNYSTQQVMQNKNEVDSIMKNIKQISLHAAGGLILTTYGDVYGWGNNSTYELGDYSTSNRAVYPSKVRDVITTLKANEFWGRNLFVLPIKAKVYPGSVALKLRWLAYMDDLVSYSIYYTKDVGDPATVTWTTIGENIPVSSEDIIFDGQFEIPTINGIVKYPAHAYMWTPPNANYSNVRIKIVPNYNH